MNTLLLERRGPVAELTFNRPESLNALDAEMAAELVGACAELGADPALRCVVLRGAGDHFMAGGDVKGFHRLLAQPAAARRRQAAETVGRLHEAIGLLQRLPQPVLASVQGAAAGLGLGLVLGADLAVAAEDATFTLAFVHLGLSPDSGSTHFLPRTVGRKRAMEIALGGERFDAARARELGVVNRVVPRADLAGVTRAWAEALARGPREALARTKALLNGSGERPLEDQLRAEAESILACMEDPDFAEGVRAFVEKRRPGFGSSPAPGDHGGRT